VSSRQLASQRVSSRLADSLDRLPQRPEPVGDWLLSPDGAASK
jgi:hypothetical protein